MGKTEAYFLNALYDDLYKFEWAALLEKTDLCIWLDVKVLKTYFANFPVSVGKPLSDFEIIKVVQSDDSTLNDDDYYFVRVPDVRSIKFTDPLLNTNFQLLLDQYLNVQLPQFVHTHIDSLMLVSLFDVKDFWDELKLIEHYKKYWLFRYKVVVMRYENEKKIKEQVPIPKTLEPYDQKTPDCLTSDAEPATRNCFKKISEADLGIKTVKETGTNENSEIINDIDSNIQKNFIDTLSSNKLNLITSLMNNIETQFLGLKEYEEKDRIQITSSFLTLLRGTVGLLENLLLWS